MTYSFNLASKSPLAKSNWNGLRCSAISEIIYSWNTCMYNFMFLNDFRKSFLVDLSQTIWGYKKLFQKAENVGEVGEYIKKFFPRELKRTCFKFWIFSFCLTYGFMYGILLDNLFSIFCESLNSNLAIHNFFKENFLF